ncbi:hypothetical protein D9619_006540 [Psilocybe cf. subviscida]|uniref:F-box domain-containing protein n=1 Tax=Psilocybe cf. subviscida TaxID=2480587 RepID=A0A8H5B5D1_9AGAR|nr:hypothetical protein D9619_006540 [Psilocybe cf. subviscida]
MVNNQVSEGYERPIQKLKVRRNALAPIAKLPPELLHRIFAIIKEESERLLQPKQSLTHPPTHDTQAALHALRAWNVVTHVCNRWRQIALDASTLWTNPPIRSRLWTMEMLKRSKTAGLALDLASDTSSSNRTVISHIKHIKTLKFQYDSAEALNFLFMGLSDEAPHLENLSIIVNVCHGSAFLLRGREVVRFLLQPLTFRGTKALRRLTLSGVDVRWDSALFHGLSHLSLRNLSAECKPTWRQLMDMLELMPELQALVLDSAFPLETPSSSFPLHLPNLKELAVYSVDAEVQSFFSRISFPPLERLYVGCRSAGPSLVDYASVITAVSRSCPFVDTFGVADIRKLKIHQRMASKYGFCIEVFRDLSRPNTFESNLEFLFGSHIDDPAIHPGNKIVRDVFGRLGFVNLTDLTIIAGTMLHARVLANTFGRLPRLNTVCISALISRKMINVLAMDTDDPTKKGLDDILFPTLHTIVFESVAFKPSALYDARVEDVQDLLIQRCEYGAPIQHLRFNCCPFLKRTDIARFSEIVPDVQWDEQEIYSFKLGDRGHGLGLGPFLIPCFGF